MQVGPTGHERGEIWRRLFAGMGDMESSAILSVLERHAQNPNFTCRWRWHEGDVVVWDERCTSHFAVRDPWDGPRSMRRVLVEGDAAIPATLG